MVGLRDGGGCPHRGWIGMIARGGISVILHFRRTKSKKLLNDFAPPKWPMYSINCVVKINCVVECTSLVKDDISHELEINI
jgi:hypothetical protein